MIGDPKMLYSQTGIAKFIKGVRSWCLKRTPAMVKDRERKQQQWPLGGHYFVFKLPHSPNAPWGDQDRPRALVRAHALKDRDSET
jgi:hypothetical protein